MGVSATGIPRLLGAVRRGGVAAVVSGARAWRCPQCQAAGGRIPRLTRTTRCSADQVSHPAEPNMLSHRCSRSDRATTAHRSSQNQEAFIRMINEARLGRAGGERAGGWLGWPKAQGPLDQPGVIRCRPGQGGHREVKAPFPSPSGVQASLPAGRTKTWPQTSHQRVRRLSRAELERERQFCDIQLLHRGLYFESHK